MKISCQSCQAKYTIADEKVLGKIVKIRCKKCGATIVINGNETGAQAQTGQGGGSGAEAFDYAAQSAGAEQWTVNVADGDQRTMTHDEIVAAYTSGVVTDETYCWKDGMADRLPVREIPELHAVANGAGGNPDQTAQEPSAATYAPAPPQEEPAAASYGGYGGGAPASAHGNGNGTGNGNGVSNGLFGSSGTSNQMPAPAAARRQGGRGGGAADLFGNVAQAGGEDDVMTSAPQGMPQASEDPGKLTGQRNENSVLFSLNALTQNAPKEETPQAIGEGSGLIDIRALSASMGNTGDGGKASRVDDIMNLGGGGAFSAALAAPVLAPPSDGSGLDFSGGQRKDNTKVMLFAIFGAGAFIALAIILVALLKKPAEPPPPLATMQAPTAETTAPTASAPSAAVTTTAVADNGAAPGSPQAPSVGGGGADPTHKAHHGGGGGGAGGGAAAAAGSPPPAAFIPPATPATTPAAGGHTSLQDALKASVPGGGDNGAPQASAGSSAPFDCGAAAAAIGSVNVASCKKSDGPTGFGHVKITFASSGSVQSAVVDAPPFAGTPVGGCVAGKFRSAHIPAFAGSSVTVGKSFVIE